MSYARFVARKTRDLTREQAAYVDERVVESADGRIPWSRFEVLVEAAVEGCRPGCCGAGRGGRARPPVRPAHRFGRATGCAGSTSGVRSRRSRGWTRRSRSSPIVLAHLGDTSSEDERRVKAVLVLANPVTALELLRTYQQWLTAQSSDGDGPRRWSTTAAAACRDGVRPPLRRDRRRRHRPRRRLRPADGSLDPRPPRRRRRLHHPPRPRHRRPGAGRRLRDPRPTSTGRASDDAGRLLPSLLEHEPIPTDRPHHRRSGASSPTGPANRGWATTASSPSSTTGSRPTAVGRSSSPSRASTSGATPSALSTSSTTPAPAESGMPPELLPWRTTSPGPSAQKDSRSGLGHANSSRTVRAIPSERSEWQREPDPEGELERQQRVAQSRRVGSARPEHHAECDLGNAHQQEPDQERRYWSCTPIRSNGPSP